VFNLTISGLLQHPPGMTTVAIRRPVHGPRLREARFAAGLTQAEVATRAAVSARTISAAENGRASAKTVRRLASILRLPPDALAVVADPTSTLAPQPAPGRGAGAGLAPR
jgi:transcriptional regulator with XRE-family HTH domain